MIIQLILIIILTSQFLITRKTITTLNEFQKFTNGFIDGNVINVFFAIVLVTLSSYGVTFGIVQSSFAEKTARLSGLGGEPRHFAAFLVTALLLILINKKNGHLFFVKNEMLKLLVLGLGVFFSFSTSAWIGLIFALCYFVSRRINPRQLLLSISIVLAGFILLNSSAFVREKINNRLVSRMVSWERFLYFAPKDGLVIFLLEKKPELLFFGTGSGGTDYHVMKIDFLNDISETVRQSGIITSIFSRQKTESLTPSSFIIKYLGEYGVIGFLLLFKLLMNMYKKLSIPKEKRFFVDFSFCMILASIPSSMLLFFMYITFITGFIGAFAGKYSKPLGTCK